nr:unnamed protein product [Callosobruchus analis]
MPRNYRKRLGSRNYKSYTQEHLTECLTSIESKELTQRKARVPTTFSTEEEVLFVDCILRLSEYGFPSTAFDLRVVIETYLDKIGRRVPKFKENCPATEWVSRFLKRHSCLSQRIAANIKRNRPAVGKETITAYIQNLEDVVRNVPPENIWNYDGTTALLKKKS